MSLTLRFATLHNYVSSQAGITVPVTLLSASDSVKFDAKVDTGSSHCIFQRQYGEQLGLEIESGASERFAAATGSLTAYGHEVTITTLGIETVAVVFFAADEHFNRNLLGRAGWLDRVRFGLIDYDSLLYLSAYDDPA